MSESDFPLPPPTLDFLVFSLKMQAEIRMGLVAIPGEEKASTDLRAARHAIDTLAMIQEKTRGNSSMEEQRLIENSLTELRFRFVQASEDAAKTVAAKVADSPSVETPELRNEPKSQE